MIIFGWDNRKLKDFGETEQKFCSKCNDTHTFKIYKETFWFTLYYINIFPHDTFYYHVCGQCSTGDKIPKIDFEELKGEFWNLKT